MGTRSTYRVIEKGVHEGKAWKNMFVLMYIQFDGYPDGHPVDTADWLAKGKLVNGLGANQPELIFNGAGCLAAQLIAKHKTAPGGTYLYALRHRGRCGEDYCYDIVIDSVTQTIEFIAYDVTGGWGDKPPKFKKLFSGTPAEYVKWIEDVYSKRD